MILFASENAPALTVIAGICLYAAMRLFAW
jgi:hypothetical protein